MPVRGRVGSWGEMMGEDEKVEEERLERLRKILERFGRPCGLCGGHPASARSVYFYGNIGMFVSRRKYELKAEMCKACLHKQFLKFTLMNIFLGWWGMISFWVTPVYILRNVEEYGSALIAFRRAKKKKL